MIVLAVAFLLPRQTMAAEVPVSVQLNLYHKIWKLDRNLANRSELVVAVLYQDTYAVSTEAKTAAMAWSGTSRVRCISWRSIRRRMSRLYCRPS